MVRGRPEPAVELVEAIGRIARALPEAYEEEAWTGVRWRIRQRTFAHVVVLDESRSAAYSHAYATDLGEVSVVTFRSSGDELLALESAGPPFLKPDRAPTVIALVLDHDTDWDEVGELITESYRLLAPRKLARLLD